MSVALPDLLPMRPFLREVVWGGRRLEGIYGKQLPPGLSIGESFELSALPGQESWVASGPLEGSPLGSLMQSRGPQLVGGGVWERFGADFPLLVKLIDASQDLSVQVHPDDDYARRCRLGCFGKMEAWYVLDSDEGRVAAGLREGVDLKTLTTALDAGRAAEVIRYYAVSAGDLVFLPPGTVHALCGGVMVYEVQQASDLTFRLYDYDRVGIDGKLRELHVARALEVVDVDSRPHIQPHPTGAGCGEREGIDSGAVHLVESEHFRLTLHRAGEEASRHQTTDSFLALTHVKGGEAEVGAADGSCRMRLGETVLIPAGREISVTAVDVGAPKVEYLAASAIG